ncbi:Rne/Rng family ribonuclease [Sphingomonas yunnanensis]|uniref:Rne/Rng family ribonuclease n=1 Tax=Sphingomonas yunnanensis TaxID=310400 RepID=UPI001CA7B51C|nr:Rne/Rng family ribonuclease [Sphingomonas yunnanensis]MBY9063879.1 Rne/Rng family ribonuclease [Sphingomonas yunnanensis]
MLIDARHREETRVAVVKGNRIEEFDFESAERKQLKGNIYLAKVTRVEPSLQAAFVDYGGNRHGFLAFSEIHPDYYQIPKEDRDALLREEAEHAAEEAALRAEQDAFDDAEFDGDEDELDADEHDHDDGVDDDAAGETGESEDDAGGEPRQPRSRRGRAGANDDQVEALRQRRMSLRRRYKIQDVIRRRQVLLVQVVKEERGNKGAALTSYLSLAGRYCVLMPNTSHGGGISRKISNAGDRKRLKTIMAELALPSSMGCIVRTAGLQRTKTEIKRDFDYLARLWDEIREKTLSSSAPALIYGDSDLMKRAIRDIYNKDIDEVIVEGSDGYRQAKEFMRLLMPSHAKKVKHYSDPVPLFQRAGVEEQLAAMYHPVVQLKSGGYLVINPTEALVSIDINSGRSTREHNIEQTATATNLEAAHEIARQLRLRDMAGLVVIDFIDMDNGSNVRKVEKAMKEALKNDRARIQVGRISSFGLMEMSRQRLRTGVLEASTRPCPHCEGTGFVRTASSSGISALRLIEDEAARGRGSLLTLRCSQEAAFYVLNRKRSDIAEIEDRYGVQVEIIPDEEQEGARMSVEANGPPPAHAPKFDRPIVEAEDDLIEDEVEEEFEDEEVEETAAEPRARADQGDDEGGRGNRRRRRRRGRRGRTRPDGEGEGDVEAAEGVDEEELVDTADPVEDEEAVEAEADASAEAGEREGGRRRRRGRRNRRREGDRVEEAAAPTDASVEPVEEPEADPIAEPLAAPEPEPAPVPKTRRRPRARAATAAVTEPEVEVEEPEAETPAPAPVAEDAPAKPKRTRRKKVVEPIAEAADAGPVNDGLPAPDVDEPEAVEPAAKPKRTRRKKADVAPVDETPPAPEPEADATAEPETEAEPTPADGEAAPRRGWWQRTFGA